MDLGRFNRKVTIQSEASGQDAAGQPNGAWSTFAEVWANVRYGSGSEAIRADAVTSSTKASIRIRYRTDVTTAMRLVFGSTTFAIRAVLPDEQGRKFTDLVCEVVQ
jgi:SPP1 family predicted phage head-tail adaptor